MPRPFALRFRLPVTPVDRTKVVPNSNPCQIVSIMAEFPRATVPATAPRVLFWQKGRGGTGGAKQEGKQPGSGRRHTAATRAISRGVGQGRGKEQPGKEGQSGKERVAGKTRGAGKTRAPEKQGRRKIERKNRPAFSQALRPGPKAGLTLNNYLFWSPRIRIATSRIVVSSSVTTPPSGPGSK